MQKTNIFKVSAFFVLGCISYSNVMASDTPAQPSTVGVTSSFVVNSLEKGWDKVLKDLDTVSPEVRLVMYAGLVLVGYKLTQKGFKVFYRLAKDLGGSCKSAVSLIHDDVISVGSNCKDACKALHNDMFGKKVVVKKKKD